MSGEARVEITDNADLLRVIEEVHRTRRPCIVSRDSEPLALVSPIRSRRGSRQPSAADLAATRSAAGAWKGVVDVPRFKRDNRRHKMIPGRPPAELSPTSPTAISSPTSSTGNQPRSVS
jgi:hypothetical protein